MAIPSKNESWLVHTGSDVIEKKAEVGIAALSERERLIYCLWVIDYCMRNSGDLVQVDLIHNNCLSEAAHLASSLSLDSAKAAFSLSAEALEIEYESLFESICNEVKYA